TARTTTPIETMSAKRVVASTSFMKSDSGATAATLHLKPSSSNERVAENQRAPSKSKLLAVGERKYWRTTGSLISLLVMSEPSSRLLTFSTTRKVGCARIVPESV